ncbi:MAG: hypothetical protein ACEPOZ_19560 [Marinifilaceae bacterium]
MNFKDFSLAEKLQLYRVVANNSVRIAEIKNKLALYGYNEEKLTILTTLLQEVEGLTDTQAREYGEQYAATEQVTLAHKTAHKVYMKHVKLARILFEDDLAAYGALGLQGRRKDTMSGWLRQASSFYNNLLANETYITALASFNCPLESLTQGKDFVEAVATALEEQDRERGEARKATRVRDEKLELLDSEMSRLLKVLGIAFEEDPEILEQLGITVAS